MNRFLVVASFTLLACSSDAVVAPPPPADTGPPCTFDGAAEPELPTPPRHTPRWAFEPWISKDISDRDDSYAFVKGFADRDIPVGVLVIDSPWETSYNTLIPSPTRYPEFGKMVSDFRAKGVRVVLWTTQMVNEKSWDFEPGGDKYDGVASNFDEGLACGFFVDEGTTYGWWKGKGAGIDFFDARARAWWHRQQKPLLDLGVAGYKLDFGEQYIDNPMVRTDKGEVPHQTYSEEYYRDFLAYGVSVRGPEEFLTMVRAWDESYGFKGRFYAKKEHAPVVWAGDNRRDWVGLADALDELLFSAQAGYVVLGSDVGGYLDFDDVSLAKVPPDTLVFARWTAIGALMPFMQLHGRANLTPWTVADHVDETVAVYRYWSKLHHELVPFFYSLAEEAYATNGTIMTPVAKDRASWKGDFRYTLGRAFLVSPLLDATGKRSIDLPGDSERWYDWWSPASPVIAGGKRVDFVGADGDRKTIPLHVRGGAIVPLDVSDDVSGLGTKASAGHSTVLVWSDPIETKFVMHDEDGKTTTLTQKDDGTTIAVTISRATKPVLLRVRPGERAIASVIGVKVDGTALSESKDRAAFDASASSFLRDDSARALWIKLPPSTTARSVAIL